MSVLTKNKSAYFNYDIADTYLAGIVLEGWEVKSAKAHQCSLDGAFVFLQDAELFIRNMHISPWKFSREGSPEEQKRDRKLLLRKHQIRKLREQKTKAGYTIVPLAVKEVHGLVKVEIALAKGKKKFDKRKKLREKDMKRRIETERKLLEV